MNIAIKPTIFNQPTNNTNFKSNKQHAINEAVDLMTKVRSSYSEFEPSVIKNIVSNMKNQLKSVLNYQKNGGELIFRESEITAVKNKINSLNKLI